MSPPDHVISRFSPQRIFRRVPNLILRRPLVVLLIILAVTLGFIYPLPRLAFKTTVYDLVIEDLPETRRYEAFKKIFGSDEIIRIVVKAQNVFEPATFAAITALADQAARIEGVRRIISLPGIKATVDTGGAHDLKSFAALIAPVQLFERNLIAKDHKSTVITLVLKTGANNAAVLAAVRALIDTTPASLAIYQIGMPLVSEALAEFSETDFLRIPPVTTVIIALLLILLFRNLTCLVVPLATVTVAQIWTFGLMAWLGVPLTMLTMIVPVFLIAVGTAYCLHICSEYLHVSPTAADSREAVSLTFGKLAFPTVLAVVTTMIGLGTLLINDISAIREFAVFSVFGAFSLLVVILTLFPAVLVLLPTPAGRNHDGNPVERRINALLQQIIRITLEHRKIGLSIIGVFVLVCLIGITRVRVETNPVGYFKADVPVSRHFHDIYQDLSGSFPINVMMQGRTEYFFEDLANVRQIERLQRYLQTLPDVDKTVSFVDYLKLVNYTLNRYDPKFYSLPEEAFELRMLINNFKSLLGRDMLRRFMDDDFTRANVLLLTHISSSRRFLDTQSAILDHVAKNFNESLQWDVTGLGLVISASSHLLVSGQVKSLSLTLILIFAIMVALFLSSKVGCIALVPNLFPIVVNFGLMGWLGVQLSVATSLIASIAIGLAVDDTIHFLVRYNEEFKKDLDKDRALKDTILQVGQPIIFTTITISLGFAVLIFSHFEPTALFGVMMVVTMLSALVGDLILLPSLMLHVELVTAWDLLKLIPTLGGMPPGLAHEINQPLNAIKVGSEFLKRMLKQGAAIKEDQLAQVVHAISAQVDRASELINRLRDFGYKPDLAKGQVGVNDAVRAILSLMEGQLAVENIELELTLDETLPPIMGHDNRLAQVFFNLITNAGEAINADASGRNPRRITISTRTEQTRVTALVADTGIGMPAHVRDRIFEPFFTTKAVGTGKGLGLTITKEIVRDYDGRIVVESSVGQGTIVKLIFPATEEK